MTSTALTASAPSRSIRFARVLQVFFVLYVASALIWLFMGLAPTLAAWDPLHSLFHRWGAGSDLWAEVAGKVGRAAHAVEPPVQVVLDYLFSAFNLAAGVFVVALRPADKTARLLALGLVGTAIAFNLQSHDAFQVAPFAIHHPLQAWHDLIHLASGICYVYALLMFPDGKLVTPRRLPFIILVTLLVAEFALMGTDDHTTGLVFLFGIVTPIAGVLSQYARYRSARTAELKQQSRVLLFALVIALAGAAALAFSTSAFSSPSSDARTLTYEVRTPGPGTYFFRCDPHPEDMVGTVVVTDAPGAPSTINISASQNEFDKPRMTLAANRDVRIVFTNHDGDLHNVALYESPTAAEPIFIGDEFSGKSTAVLAFRGFRFLFAVIPIALLVGLFRFRLWDVNRVIRRTLVYGLLAAFITVVYVAVVIGVGALVGTRGRPNVGLSIVVTAIVAVAFDPVRQRARVLANRLAYGDRATPYQALVDLSNHIAAAPDTEQVLEKMAEIIGEATNAATTAVWLKVGSSLVEASRWPRGQTTEAVAIEALDNHLPAIPHADVAVAVRHSGEILGALTATKAAGEEFTPLERRLVADVAAQAGLALRNAKLNAELQNRLDVISKQAQELRASRERIVEAQDQERRRLERNIHDGAQQQLVSIALKLGLAESLTDKDPATARALIAQLQEETGEALDALRELARGIYPPVLQSRGLVEALRMQAMKSPLPVTVEAEGITRYASTIEAAVYFCCLEALQNAAKHGGGCEVELRLRQSDGWLTFAVADSGVGCNPESVQKGSGFQNMVDRMAAVGGSVDIRSEAGEGLTVMGRVPVAHNPETHASQGT